MTPILLTCMISTAAMTGLIWFVQIVHYPLFEAVGREQFANYEQRHSFLTTWVVLPLMFAELGTSIWLAVYPPENFWLAMQAGAAMTVLIWLSTFALQVPKHRILERGFDQQAWKFLVNSNWIRTVLWTCRTALMCWVVAE